MNVAVVGAGPAGLSAALCAAEAGLRATLIDDNFGPGGQIWRGAASDWSRRLSAAGVRAVHGARVFSVSPGALLVEQGTRSFSIPFDKVVLATGSRELFLPFPGWTLPGVMGAGGLQALAKSGLPVDGKRIVVAGTGPLLLAVAAYLQRHGARIVTVAEQAPWSKLLRFGLRLPWSKRAEAAKLWRRTYRPGTWVTAAAGNGKLQQVTLANAANPKTIECDYLAVGYGLVPNSELASLMGCEPGQVNDFQESSVPGVFCAGEITGVGGADLAQLEGEIAGWALAGRHDEARKRFAARRRWREFALHLSTAFELRSELRYLARPETLVCRCEDVSVEQLSPYGCFREAKLQTRCGMGACQARICGPATTFLFGWKPESVRPPVFPARIQSFILESESTP